jgi:hypothetical protein
MVAMFATDCNEMLCSHFMIQVVAASQFRCQTMESPSPIGIEQSHIQL